MFSPVSFFPFQLWINQASSDSSHVSYLSRGHANCNGEPRKALPVGEDTSELIQALQETSDVCTSLVLCRVYAHVGLNGPVCIRNGGIYLFWIKLGSAIIYFILSRVIVSVPPSDPETAERKMNVGG